MLNLAVVRTAGTSLVAFNRSFGSNRVSGFMYCNLVPITHYHWIITVSSHYRRSCVLNKGVINIRLIFVCLWFLVVIMIDYISNYFSANWLINGLIQISISLFLLNVNRIELTLPDWVKPTIMMLFMFLKIAIEIFFGVMAFTCGG